MSNHANNQPTDLLAELYRIDPELERYEAELPNLIIALTKHQPTITLDEAFVQNLRVRLMEEATKQMTTPTPVGAVPSPFIWWATRLTPVGFALLLLITLIPDTDTPVIPEQLTEEVPPQIQSEVATMMYDTTPPDTTPEAVSDEAIGLMASEPATMAMKAPAGGLVVEPPIVGNTATITTMTLPEAGWVVIYTDAGGAFGQILSNMYFEAGTYDNIPLSLTRTLSYPEMITVVVYTAKEKTEFVTESEVIQIDPLTNAAMTVTVPVVSELELGLSE